MNTISLHGMPLTDLPLTFIDVETTGLLPAQGHRICEVALIRVQGGQVITSFETLVNPQRPIEAGAFAVNGIADDWLHDAPLFGDLADTLIAMLEGSALVAHNAPFDLVFLIHELALIGQPALLNPTLDTLTLARRLLRRSSNSLVALARDLHLPLPVHRAMSDVLALRGLFDYLVDQMAPLNLITLGDMLHYQRGLPLDQPTPQAPPLIDQALREGRRLRIVYASRTTGGPVERLVRPLELTMNRKGFLLRAYCYLRNDLRSFALDRIESAVLE